MTKVIFKILPKNTQIKYFWSEISFFLVLHKTFLFHKFESANFKCDNNFFKTATQNTQVRQLWPQI